MGFSGEFLPVFGGDGPQAVFPSDFHWEFLMQVGRIPVLIFCPKKHRSGLECEQVNSKQSELISVSSSAGSFLKNVLG
jgi:hypothetical protein